MYENLTAVRTATINGRRYQVDVEQIDGWCDQYACNERFIHLIAPLNTQKGLITAIHEALHASNWAKSETTVDRTSKDIGRLLWRLGYRLRAEGEQR